MTIVFYSNVYAKRGHQPDGRERDDQNKNLPSRWTLLLGIGAERRADTTPANKMDSKRVFFMMIELKEAMKKICGVVLLLDQAQRCLLGNEFGF